MFNLGAITSYGSKLFGGESDTTSDTPINNELNSTEANPQQLETLGINTQELDNQVNEDINNTQKNTFSLDEYYKKLDVLKKNNPNASDEEIWNLGLKLSKEKGYNIEGLDLDQEIKDMEDYQGANTKPIQEEQVEQVDNMKEETNEETEKQGAFGKLVDYSVDKTKEAIPIIGEGMKNFSLGSLGELGGALGDTTGFLIGKPVDYLLKKSGYNNMPSLEAQFKKDGEKIKEEVRKVGGVPDDSKMAKIGEIGTDIALLFIPGGEAKLTTAFPKYSKEIASYSKYLEGIKKASPKTYAMIKGGLEGMTDTAKFDVVSKGDLEATDIALGGAGGAILGGTTKAIQETFKTDAPGKLREIIKQSTKSKPAQVKKDMNVMTGLLKENNKHPKDVTELRNDFEDISKKLYKDKINPLIKSASEKGVDTNVNISGLIDDIIPELKQSNVIDGKSVLESIGKGNDVKKLNSMIKGLKKNFNDLSLEQAEQLKQTLSAINRAEQYSKASKLSSSETEFISALNKSLGDKIDNIITDVEGTGIKGFKSEYGSIARNMDSLNAAVIRDGNLTGDSLFNGLGKISGMGNIAEGNVSQGLSQLIVGKILKMQKNPNEIVTSMTKELYRTGDKLKVTKKGLAGASAYTGEQLDNTFGDK